MHFSSLAELDSTDGIVSLVNHNNREQHVKNSDIALIPQPSDDPNDPLRWPRWRKDMAFFSVCMFVFFNNFSGTVLSDSFFPISLELGVSIDTAAGLISWVILTLGLSNFFWVPTALYFGKRPVFLAASGLVFVAAIWAAASPSFGSLQAACVVGAFGGGASEALGAAIINDIYFLHERGVKMGWYVIALALGSSVGPLCGGYIIESKGWAWGKWVSAIFTGVTFLLIVFFAPETQFKRDTNLAHLPSESDAASSETKTDSKHLESSNQPVAAVPPAKSFPELLKPWSGRNDEVSFWGLMFKPVPLLLYPACAFAALAYSICLAPTVMINVLSSTILIPPPYNFSIGSVGLINIPGIIGQLAGAVMGGIAIDKWATYRARRNGGLFKPESRLVLILLPSLFVFVGIILFGFAVGREMHWAVIFVAYGMVSVGLTGTASIAMTYVCDSYFPVAAECLEMINGLKNVIAFAFIKASVPWVANQGYERTFGALAGIFFAFVGLCIPFIFWGARIRHYTSVNWRLVSFRSENAN